MKLRLIATLGSLLLLSTSCAWYRSVERSLVEDEKKERRAAKGPVSRDQYNQLLVKYEELSKKYEQIKESKSVGESSLVDELQRTQGDNFASNSAQVETETVDIFPPAGSQVVSSTSPSVPASLEAQLQMYRQALGMKATDSGEALKLFQELETKAAPSVQVRAKFQVGEILFSKGQHDLALQVFEDIINKHAHSGVVVDALRFAAASSEKLGLGAKRDQYHSMLKDVFEVR